MTASARRIAFLARRRSPMRIQGARGAHVHSLPRQTSERILREMMNMDPSMARLLKSLR